VQDRLVKAGLLEIRSAPDIGSRRRRRVRQLLFNLLANAVGFRLRGRPSLAADSRMRWYSR
jgi:hypothetical protein